MPPLRIQNFHAVANFFGEHFFEQLAVLEFHGRVNEARDVRGVEVELIEQRRKKFRWLKIFEIFPVEIAAIDDAAAAQVKDVDGDLRRLGVPGDDVGVVTIGRGNFLALVHFFQSFQQVAIAGGLFEALFVRRQFHALFEAAREIVAAAFEQKFYVARGFGVAFIGDEAGDAGAEAAVNVILKTGTRMRARKVHSAGWHAEMFVDEVDEAVGETRREVRAEINRAVFIETPRDVHAGEFFVGGVLDVRVGFVIAEQDVEFGFVPLD